AFREGSPRRQDAGRHFGFVSIKPSLLAPWRLGDHCCGAQVETPAPTIWAARVVSVVSFFVSGSYFETVVVLPGAVKIQKSPPQNAKASACWPPPRPGSVSSPTTFAVC